MSAATSPVDSVTDEAAAALAASAPAVGLALRSGGVRSPVGVVVPVVGARVNGSPILAPVIVRTSIVYPDVAVAASTVRVVPVAEAPTREPTMVPLALIASTL